MLEPVGLLDEGLAQPRVAVAKGFAPPAGDGVEQFRSIGEPDAATLGADDVQRRKRVVVAHLGARMPEHREVAGDEFIGVDGVG